MKRFLARVYWLSGIPVLSFIYILGADNAIPRVMALNISEPLFVLLFMASFVMAVVVIACPLVLCDNYLKSNKDDKSS